MTRLLEENNLVGTNYAEPYAGGAGLALRLLMDEYVGDIYINDLDPSIHAFWYAVLNNADELCEWIETVPVTVEEWYSQKEVQTNYTTVDRLDLAKSTFFLNRTNVSGVITGGIIGGINQTGKYKIDARFNKAELIRKIQEIHRFADRIHLSNLDGVKFVQNLERRKENIFVYLDPPYYKKGSDLYLNAFKDADHKKLADYVHRMKKLHIVSYDNQEFIMNLYHDDPKVRYQLSQCTSNRIGDEILIFDPRMRYAESIEKLNSPIAI